VFSPLLETKNVSKTFGGLSALKEVSFDVREDEIVGMIGPNGAGKTTMFDIITGLQRPSGGDVYFEGRSIRRLLPHSICKLGIARTYQNVRPFLNHTVRQNIEVGIYYGRGFPGTEDDGRKTDEILDLIKLKSKQDSLAKNLPIEQRKMIEVGRALATNPKLLMLDEPMAGLNPFEVVSFVELIKILRERKITVLIVEHVMRAISSACTRVIVLHHGEKLVEGTPGEVLSNKTVVDIYLGESYSNPSS